MPSSRTTVEQLARRRGWLLDLDGTLLDSSPGVIRAFHAAQRMFQEPLAPPEEIRKRIGYPLEDTVKALSKVDYPLFVEPFRKEALATMHLHSRLLPGALELLSWLRGRNKRCAVVTSKRRQVAMQVLVHLGIDTFFEFVLGSDSAGAVKPDPAPLVEAMDLLSLPFGEGVMVGDTRNDIVAAHGAGIPVIALASGHDGRSLLGGADVVLEDAWELWQALRQTEELRP